MSRICRHCSSEIDDESGLCPVCFLGEGLKEATVECPRCRIQLDGDPRFCSECGSAVPRAAASTGDPIHTALAERLRGQYQLLRLLGRGGMGSVYLARDLSLDREVAIKVVTAESGAPQTYERFRREAKTAAKLSHPNIVPLYSFGEVEGMPYFVMGYVRGESLADRLRRDGRLPEDEARRIGAEIADALDHAHRQGVIHRDVKPDNVLLEDESGRALLTDFGVARAIEAGETLTQHGSVIGTPDYMSPEQAAGEATIDARSDIYSLGVLSWGMLTGRLPFEGTSPAEVLRKHLTQEPPALRSVAPYVSDRTAQAIERCLAKKPEGRWPDARSLRIALADDGESSLPDALRPAESSGVPALAATWALTIFYAALMGGEGWGCGAGEVCWDRYLVTGGMPLLALFVYAFFLNRLRREGVSPGESQRVIWREPSWWLWWYPRSLRRTGNVWDRLPATVRYLRWSIAAFVMNVVAGWTIFSMVGAQYASRSPRAGYGAAAMIQFTILILTVIAWALFTILARRELTRKGLFEEDVNRVMMSVPPSRSGFWARPHIAAILAPASAGEPGRGTGSPHELLQSVLRQADELSGPLRPLGAQAAHAARQLVTSIEFADREIAELSRNLEPGEEKRLSEKIEALSKHSEDTDANAPMRTLLEQQLDLIREISTRIEAANEKRARRVEMLRTLALHVGSLRSRQTPQPSELREISDTVRALCEDIARHASSLASAAAIAPTGSESATTAEKER
ncbi:MAG: protein kinase [Acidobacteria bacterium]|nr:protein kinase [Acidobacteriota bacterium]